MLCIAFPNCLVLFCLFIILWFCIIFSLLPLSSLDLLPHQLISHWIASHKLFIMELQLVDQLREKLEKAKLSREELQKVFPPVKNLKWLLILKFSWLILINSSYCTAWWFAMYSSVFFHPQLPIHSNVNMTNLLIEYSILLYCIHSSSYFLP